MVSSVGKSKFDKNIPPPITTKADQAAKDAVSEYLIKTPTNKNTAQYKVPLVLIDAAGLSHVAPLNDNNKLTDLGGAAL